MRQGQQNRRGRGRNNNSNNNNNTHNNHNRKGQNPLSRSYESTGPDTKIRGTPAHIAEKYMQLARDAQSSGDPVLAENYLQHAEHYNRIIMTFREQQMQQNGGVDQGPANGQSGRFRSPGMEDEFSDEEGDEFSAGNQMRQEPQPRYEGGQRFDEQRQPRHDNQRNQHHQQNRDRGDRDQRNFDRGERGDRPERFERNDRGDRNDRGGDRPERLERSDRGERTERPERVAAPPEAAAEALGGQRRRERAPIPPHEQPEFLRRPVRRPRRESVEEDSADAAAPASTEENVQD